VFDDEFNANIRYMKNPCEEPDVLPSWLDLQAHSAPLGLSFIPEEGWPEEMWHDLIIAYHGSWNRSVPTGYKVVRVHIDASGKPVKTEDFITGWLTKDGTKLGRPTGVRVLPGGTMYVADDVLGAVYRVVRE
jgi:glucose/arabinose dehydrogenase